MVRYSTIALYNYIDHNYGIIIVVQDQLVDME